jgi:hypothetical protein
VLPRLMGYPLTIQNSDRILQAKTIDTCIRRNKTTIISIFTKVFLFQYHFRLLPFPFHCFSYFSETNLNRSGISVIVFTPSCNVLLHQSGSHSAWSALHQVHHRRHQTLGHVGSRPSSLELAAPPPRHGWPTLIPPTARRPTASRGSLCRLCYPDRLPPKGIRRFRCSEEPLCTPPWQADGGDSSRCRC